MSIWKFTKSTSVRGLILNADETHICLIRREKRGQLYYVAPGGGLEKGEDPIVGLRREVQEETGLTLEAGGIARLGAIEFEGTQQVYYSARTQGQLIAPSGQEASLLWQKDNGLFHPEWIAFSALKDLPFVSPVVLKLLVAYPEQGWPHAEFHVREKERATRKLKVS